MAVKECQKSANIRQSGDKKLAAYLFDSRRIPVIILQQQLFDARTHLPLSETGIRHRNTHIYLQSWHLATTSDAEIESPERQRMLKTLSFFFRPIP